MENLISPDDIEARYLLDREHRLADQCELRFVHHRRNIKFDLDPAVVELHLQVQQHQGGYANANHGSVDEGDGRLTFSDQSLVICADITPWIPRSARIVSTSCTIVSAPCRLRVGMLELGAAGWSDVARMSVLRTMTSPSAEVFMILTAPSRP